MNVFYRKLKNKFRSRVVPWLVKFSVFLNSPWLTAQILAAYTQSLNEHGEYTVLCLRRSIFMDDVWAMIRYSGRIRYISLERSYFTAILTNFLSKQEQRALSESNYHNSSIGAAGKMRYYNYLQRVVPTLQRKLGFQAICSANFGYVQQQELMAVAKDLEVPFIVLHKEAMDVYGDILDIYNKYKFVGTRALFYNQRARNELIERIDGLTHDKTAVVGIPRFDCYFHELHKPIDKHLVFFSFFPRDKFLTTLRDEEKLTQLKKKYADFHKFMIDFAARHPDFHVTIKTKIAGYYLDYVLDIYYSHYPDKLANLEITNSANTTDLIRDSMAVIGFDSTALIEAVACSRPIVRPDFREFAQDSSWDFLSGYEELVNYVKVFKDFEKRLLNLGSVNSANRKREEFLMNLIGTSSGGASVKAEQKIIEVIGNKG